MVMLQPLDPAGARALARGVSTGEATTTLVDRMVTHR
jgi:hypothetical protein